MVSYLSYKTYYAEQQWRQEIHICFDVEVIDIEEHCRIQPLNTENILAWTQTRKQSYTVT